MSGLLDGRYPRPLEEGGEALELRWMRADDQAAVLRFAATLDDHDLLFLRRNIREPKVVAAWAEQIERGELLSLVAVHAGEVAGCSAIVIDPHSWSPHVGELRVLLGADFRSQGLGRILMQESFLVAMSLGLEKLTAQMTADQDAAIRVFQDMGFRPEALFRDHVKDAAGTAHDIVVLSFDVHAYQARAAQYGLDEAFE